MELPQLILSSSSARRQALLNQLKLRYAVVEPNISEVCLSNEPIAECIKRLALSKAIAGALLVHKIQNLPVLGADTGIVVEDKLLGKPSSKNEYIEMLKLLSGKSHKVYSTVTVLNNHETHI